MLNRWGYSNMYTAYQKYTWGVPLAISYYDGFLLLKGNFQEAMNVKYMLIFFFSKQDQYRLKMPTFTERS